MATTLNNPRIDRLLEAEMKIRFSGSGRTGTRAAVLEQLVIERLESIKHERRANEKEAKAK